MSITQCCQGLQSVVVEELNYFNQKYQKLTPLPLPIPQSLFLKLFNHTLLLLKLLNPQFFTLNLTVDSLRQLFNKFNLPRVLIQSRHLLVILLDIPVSSKLSLLPCFDHHLMPGSQPGVTGINSRCLTSSGSFE